MSLNDFTGGGARNVVYIGGCAEKDRFVSMDHLPATDFHPRKRRGRGEEGRVEPSPSERVHKRSKKFYFCRRQNGACCLREESRLAGGQREKENRVGRQKNSVSLARKERKKKKREVRPYVENASQTDTESKARAVVLRPAIRLIRNGARYRKTTISRASGG